ncbi:putative acetyltransferase [Gordonia effusa NBRC 100432]|uniref:Putative acetyltransferase n=1 Tax=Gordonia effusa NBRC 100432 TaxID=1077974 RepID=H0R673_9ACTN|nr:GNAT family protein [Gordonia effusa]GAB20574.1 putative acetyltransferase [Gordonia effusa NBRC 100432]
MNSSTVTLIPARRDLLEALISDPRSFERLVGSPIPAGWPEFPESVEHTLTSLRSAPTSATSEWTMHLFTETATGALIGSGGYYGPPVDGVVEIGYEIAPEFRGRGLATHAAAALIQKAADAGVTQIKAHTLAGPNPSTGVLNALGFEFVAEQHDPDEGPLWEWSRALV